MRASLVLCSAKELQCDLRIVNNDDGLTKDSHRANWPILVFVLQPVVSLKPSTRFGQIVNVPE
jgi:hypothetical protein